MLDIDTVLGWRGRPVLDRGGEKVGTLGEIYLDDATDRPAYAGVSTGLFKRRESVVPLAEAQETPDGIRLPYTAERIKEAPNVDPDVALDDDEQSRLREHYGERSQIMSGDDGPEAEMVRSEEQVEFGVAPAQPRERVRLKKYTVTEHVEKTVPVRREEIRVEHDPPPEGRVVDVQDVEKE
jgi:PRC-barrel domain/Domain of unknown function (DUF2382)